MSPILVRPVREQLEHDRVIRLSAGEESAPVRRRESTPAAEQNAAGREAARRSCIPIWCCNRRNAAPPSGRRRGRDGRIGQPSRGARAMGAFRKLRVPFHLYVPAGMVDVARRLCEDSQIRVSEIWSFHSVGDQVRFTLVDRSREPVPSSSRTPRPRRAGESSSRKPAPRAVKSASAGAPERPRQKSPRATRRK